MVILDAGDGGKQGGPHRAVDDQDHRGHKHIGGHQQHKGGQQNGGHHAEGVDHRMQSLPGLFVHAQDGAQGQRNGQREKDGGNHYLEGSQQIDTHQALI